MHISPKIRFATLPCINKCKQTYTDLPSCSHSFFIGYEGHQQPYPDLYMGQLRGNLSEKAVSELFSFSSLMLIKPHMTQYCLRTACKALIFVALIFQKLFLYGL